MNHMDYIEAGLRIFGLHGATDGKCDCGNPSCVSPLKHPRSAAWQHTPHWSDEQLDVMQMMGQLATGWGVLVSDGLLVVDIDPRNGGMESYTRMGLPLKEQSGFVVATGGGGWHIYFRAPADAALVSHVKSLPGIDFKSSGYVVGAGSLHASGLTYDAEKGHPCDIGPAPAELLELLRQPDRHRAEHSGGIVDVSSDDIAGMLAVIDPDVDYETWVQLGMAVHDATGGAGLDLWDVWSARGKKYQRGECDKKWHSFGRCHGGTAVTIGTLIYHAERAGWSAPVTFDASAFEQDDDPEPAALIDTSGIDLLRPPGFVGMVSAWIDSQCRYPRERLAVAAALAAVGNAAGLRYECATHGATSNHFIFCVAGSATGKEAVQGAQAMLHRAAGIGPATHGTIKSEQEITRNLVDHQSALYIIDEIGILLHKIKNARLKGSASYLEGVVGYLMSAYSKSSGYMLLSGDVRKLVTADLQREAAALRKSVDENDDSTGRLAGRLESITRQLSTIDHGLDRPFLSMIGYTTPITFDALVDYEQTANGFFGRALIVSEPDTNPLPRKKFSAQPLPDHIIMTMSRLASGGRAGAALRVECYDERSRVPADKGALAVYDAALDYFIRRADQVRSLGLEPIPRRGFELMLKVALTLGAPSGLITAEHARWAFALICRDIEYKINLAAANTAQDDKRHDEALTRRILSHLADAEAGETLGVLSNRCRPYKRQDVEQTLEAMVAAGRIQKEPAKRGSWRYKMPG